MEVKNLTCIGCPMGCALTVSIEADHIGVEGNTCPRGKSYAESELTHPVSTLTTTVTLKNSVESRLPVKTDKAIPKESLFAAMGIAEKTVVSAPVKRGDVIVADFIEKGTNLVAGKTVEA